MATQNGTDIIIMVNGERFAAATANEFNLTTALRDTTNKDSGHWKSQEYALKECTMNGTGLVFNENKNLVRYPEDLSNAAWKKTGLAVSATKVLGPTNLLNGFQLTSLSSGDILNQGVGDLAATTTYVFSIWLKGSGDIEIEFGDDESSNNNPITITSNWVRYEVSYETKSGASSYVRIINDNATQLFISQPQLELGESATAYVPTGRLFSYFQDALINKTKLPCILTNQKDYTLSGSCLISNFSMSAPMEENTTFTADFAVDGLVTANNI
jgi:predicted secreted protein